MFQTDHTIAQHRRRRQQHGSRTRFPRTGTPPSRPASTRSWPPLKARAREGTRGYALRGAAATDAQRGGASQRSRPRHAQRSALALHSRHGEPGRRSTRPRCATRNGGRVGSSHATREGGRHDARGANPPRASPRAEGARDSTARGAISDDPASVALSTAERVAEVCERNGLRAVLIGGSKW